MGRKRRDSETVEGPPGDDVEAAVRAAARSIAKLYETDYPHPEALATDEEFLRASGRLTDPEIPFETVETLGKSSNPIVAAMAHRATALREGVPADWVEWAFRRLKRAYAGELRFLLQAIERHERPPLVARVLARITAFVDRRVAAGEIPTGQDFDETIRDAQDLAQHYLAGIAAPGGLLRLLKATLARADAGGINGGRFRPEVVERKLTQVFRPELLNRIDRVVVFRPFERDQIRTLLERELALVLQRRGFRTRPWAVEWDEAALEFLAEKGFSRELGARPLKRAVERYLLAPLATAIVSRSFPEGEQFLFITARDERIEVTFVDPDAGDADAGAATAPVPGALRLERLVLGARGDDDEKDFLEGETGRLRSIVDGDDWRGRKERDLESIRSDASFWDSPGRFEVLARIEYVDRVEAALRTAENLSGRLSRLGRNGHGSARELVQLLADRLYLLDRACSGIDASQPADAFLEIRATAIEPVEQDFAVQLREMYEAWARRRGMRVRRLSGEATHLLSFSGIAAYRILEGESGLHVFEAPRDERSFDRVAVQVTVALAPSAPPDADPADVARRALAETETATTVVRRYRTRPSPLVRDSVREWRTGRLDRVLDGEFDVIVDGSS
jgi:ATP-dependent Clp protease ATP-binding subunit ClpC